MVFPPTCVGVCRYIPLQLFNESKRSVWIQIHTDTRRYIPLSTSAYLFKKSQSSKHQPTQPSSLRAGALVSALHSPIGCRGGGG